MVGLKTAGAMRSDGGQTRSLRALQAMLIGLGSSSESPREAIGETKQANNIFRFVI